MIKIHKRTNSGHMRRAVRIFLNDLNKGKTEVLGQFLSLYGNVVRYYIEMMWSDHNFTSQLADKQIIDRAVKKFNITARLSQCACKQAKEIVNSQREKDRKTMPLFRNVTANIDQRFVRVEKFQGHFDWAITLSSGLPKIIIPFNNTKQTLKFLNDGWQISKSLRIGIKKTRLFVDLIFEKEMPLLKEKGNILGIDVGYRIPIATSEGKLLGDGLKAKIEKTDKRRKRFHYYIGTELNRLVKQVELEPVKTVVIENLKNVKRGKRGKFSRKVNRLLSFWHYARVAERLRQLCEENGVRLTLVSPYKTSQRCPLCGKIDSRNRNADKFRCLSCNYQGNADITAALNLKVLGLAGLYSVRSLQNQFSGIYVH